MDRKIKRLKELTEYLNKCRNTYYNENKSLITDYEYDNLYDELENLENETTISFANSPTKNVGFEVKSELKKVRHSHPMLSLDKTKSEQDLIKFASNKDCILSCKMDGLTCLLTYNNGILQSAETRGNAYEGEDITHNAKVFENIPLTIPYKGLLEVEGEAIIRYSDFEKINTKLPEENKYKNPRNLASGSVRQLDSKIAKERHVRFVAWKVPFIESDNEHSSTMLYRLNFVKQLGFDIIPLLTYTNNSSDKENLPKMIESLKNEADKFSYPIDGLVMTYNDIGYGESLGVTGHHPKHSIAFKFYDEEVITTLRDIEWSMGKVGQLTPVAVFEPVEIEGTTVERASVHNVSILTQLDLQIGDEITVYKANQIIPQVKENLSAKNRESYIQIPGFCPICNSPTKIKRDNSTNVLICTNPNCKGKLLGKVSHFVSKKGMDIDGLSEETLKKFIELEWINNIYDVYNLNKHFEKLKSFSGFGKKSVDKLKESIETSKTTTLKQFISALSIPNVGTTQAKILAKQFNTWDKFYEAAMGNYNFSKLEGFGDVMNNNIHKWFVDDNGSVEQIVSLLTFKEEDTNTTPSVDLTGKTFVITGSVHIFKNRDEFKEFVESANGKVSGSVSKNTYALVNNDKASNSSKNKKAKELNIPIVTEEEFINKYIRSDENGTKN